MAPSPHDLPSLPSRRDVLRWGAALGVAGSAPLALAACKPVPTPMPLRPDASVRPLGFVGGTDVVVGQGGWCWFQSPRASMAPGGVLWLGASVSKTGTDLDGSVQVHSVDTVAGEVRSTRTVARTREDDHTSPSVLAVGDRVQVAWALHQGNDYLDVGDVAPNGSFAPQRIRRPTSTRAPGRGTSYASVHIVGGDRWLLYRGEQFSWNLLTSNDAGATWLARGLVVAPAGPSARPYVAAVSDGTRLHLLANDGNPAEFPGTSIYAGTVGTDLKVRDASGAVVGSVGGGAPVPSKLTRLLAGTAAPAEVGEPGDVDHWLSDLQFIDSRPTAVVSTRMPWPDGRPAGLGAHRLQYHWARQRAGGWTVEPLAWAGSELAPRNVDYAGLGAQDPSEPRRVVISTNVHPVTEAPLVSAADGKVHWELFEGWRTGAGAWTWTPVTANSVEDNVRPVIAAGGAHKALAWMRGRYWGWTAFNTRIVVRRAVAAPTPPSGP